MKLEACLIRFFDQYLQRVKGVSLNTVMAYRQSMGLFLPFAARSLNIDIRSLEMEHLSPDLILDFLDHLEKDRHNCARTRGHRLAAFKSLARMIRFLYPEHKSLADRIISIPQKRFQRKLMFFLTHEQVMKVLECIDLKRFDGFRDYAMIHLLYDSGVRAHELASLRLDYFDPEKKSLAILGKGNRFRQIEIWPKTVQLLTMYIQKYRPVPRPMHQNILFLNQRRQCLTRNGIYRLCRKYLMKALGEDKIRELNPVHCFRHSCAINMLNSGFSLTDIKNHLGHENLQSTMVYLKLDLTRKKELQKKFIEYTQNQIKDEKLDELINWENEQETLNWLDSL